MKNAAIAVTFLFLCAMPSYAKAETATYVGEKKCKACHIKQAKKWEETKHSKAFDALKDNEKKDPKCIGCHTTNNDVNLPGVQCEACHGAGSLFSKPLIMNKKKFEESRDAQTKLAVEAGLTVAPNEQNCKKCHNEKSPHYKGFEFKKRYEEIKHK
ncbi:MAG: multiheme c-type cytochrome [Pseudomonadota bacterium]